MAGPGGSVGSTGTAGSTGIGGSVGGTSVGGGTGLGGTPSSASSGGRGGSAGATTGTASGGSTSSPDAGTVGTGGSPRLDGGANSGPDASTPIDAPAVSKPDGAEAGVDTGRAEATADDGGASDLSFCRTTSTGCQCTPVATGEPALSACSKASLGGADQAYCCKASAHCSCDSVGCAADVSAGRCTCDFASLLSTLPPTYTKVAQCPAPASGFKCCLNSAQRFCSCKQQECSDGSTEVTTCTPAQLSVCASGEQAVDSCK